MPRGVTTSRLPHPVAELRVRRERSRGSAACGSREKKKFAKKLPRGGTDRKEPARARRPAAGRSCGPKRPRRGSARGDEVFAISAAGKDIRRGGRASPSGTRLPTGLPNAAARRRFSVRKSRFLRRKSVPAFSGRSSNFFRAVRPPPAAPRPAIPSPSLRPARPTRVLGPSSPRAARSEANFAFRASGRRRPPRSRLAAEGRLPPRRRDPPRGRRPSPRGGPRSSGLPRPVRPARPRASGPPLAVDIRVHLLEIISAFSDPSRRAVPSIPVARGPFHRGGAGSPGFFFLRGPRDAESRGRFSAFSGEFLRNGSR